MQKLALTLSTLLLILAGCQPAFAPNPEASLPDAATPEEALAALVKETGHPWVVRYQADVHTPAFLEGKTEPLAMSPTDAGRAGVAFLKQHAALFGAAASDVDGLALTSAEIDDVGMTHTRYAQRIDGVPVWNGELALHFDRGGSLVRINGRYLPLPAMSATPTKSAAWARRAALAEAHTVRPEVAVSALSTRAPKLWFYPTSPSAARLAWRVEATAEAATPPLQIAIFIDAQDGTVLHQTDTISFVEGSGIDVFGQRKSFGITQRKGVYYLEDGSHGSPAQRTYSAAGKSRLPGTEVSSRDPMRWDEAGPAHGAAVDAQANVALAFDYFSRVHGRKGWDGKGHGVRATAHYGQDYANAFFNGTQLVFGDGNADMAPPAASLDVVAHEFTHGVTAATARLDPEGQAGALNEALSDIFGCFISRGTSSQVDWQVGKAIFHPGGMPRPIRDLAHPQNTDDPATMAEYAETTEDNGGVHLNSTIVSHAAYLMTEGGDESGVRVRGIGPEHAEQIWYRALTRYLTPHATFADAADATLAAAKDLGNGDEQAVHDAWLAVGVLRQ